MNITEALEARRVKWKPHYSRKDEIFICCPFCDDNRFRLGINTVTGYAHCFNGGCEWSSRSAQKTLKELSKQLDIEQKELELSEGEREVETAHLIKLPYGYQGLWTKKAKKDYWGRKARRLLLKRGVTPEQIKEKAIGYTTVGPYAYRVIVPVLWKTGISGFIGRDFADRGKKKKYKNSVGRKTLFNVPRKKAYGAVLSEGFFDALAVERGCRKHRLDLDSLGVLGHNVTEDLQLPQLKRYKVIYLWLDPDKAGVHGTIATGNLLLAAGFKVKAVVGELGDPDPSDCEDIVYEKLKSAKKVTPGFLLKLRNNLSFYEE